MALDQWDGTLDISEILSRGSTGTKPVPHEWGCYCVRIKEKSYKPDLHGQSRVIYIGGMKASESGSLSKRMGEFVAAAMGFGTWHAGGDTFWREHERLQLSVHDILIQYRISEDPICAEVDAFDDFERDFPGSKPLLCKNRPRQRCGSHSGN